MELIMEFVERKSYQLVFRDNERGLLYYIRNGLSNPALNNYEVGKFYIITFKHGFNEFEKDNKGF